MGISKESDSQSKHPDIGIGCQYLGLLADPETRIAEASEHNYCHLQDPSKAVDAGYQSAFCLADSYKECEIYRAITGDIEQVSESDIIEEEDIDVPPAIKKEDGDGYELEETGAAVAVEGSELPQSSDIEWRRALHDEAVNRYDEVSTSKQGKRLWTVLFIFALLILIFSAWGIYNRFGQIASQDQQDGGGQSAGSLATAVSEMGVAANAWATAAYAIEAGSQSQATQQAATEAALAILANQEQVAAATEVPSDIVVTACSDLESITYEIIEGPNLTPNQGTRYVIGSAVPDIHASWLVKNTGNCNWETITLISMNNESGIITPILYRNEEPINLANPDGKVLIPPGDEIEIIIPYELAIARDMDTNYVVMVNGISLTEKPRLILLVDGWLISVNPLPTATAIPPPKRTKPPGGAPGERPTETPPSGRP